MEENILVKHIAKRMVHFLNGLKYLIRASTSFELISHRKKSIQTIHFAEEFLKLFRVSFDLCWKKDTA